MGFAAALPPPRPVLYLRAARIRYVPTSGVPALAGGLVAIGAGGATWWLLGVAVVAVMLVHCGVNVTNDVEDFARGVDTEEKMDNSRVFTLGLMSPREGRLLSLAYYAAGAALGLVIVAVQGPAILVVGVLGILGGWLYTGGPYPYKHLGVVDPLIILLLGPMTTLGGYTAVTGDGFDTAAAALGFVPGLVVAAVVQGNNLSDILDDGAAGVRTLAVRIGFTRARAVYAVTLALGFAVPVLLWASGLFGPAILLPLVAAPLAVARIRQALGARRAGTEALRTLAPLTAQLHLVTSVLLVAAVVVDGLA